MPEELVGSKTKNSGTQFLFRVMKINFKHEIAKIENLLELSKSEKNIEMTK